VVVIRVRAQADALAASLLFAAGYVGDPSLSHGLAPQWRGRVGRQTLHGAAAALAASSVAIVCQAATGTVVS
jgi:hypothetical protein